MYRWVLLGMVAAADGGCGRECAEGNPLIDEYYGVRIHAQPGAVVGLELADACAGGRIKACGTEDRWRFEPGCAQYLVIPARGGTCRIDVLLADGTRVSRSMAIDDHRAECGRALDLRPTNQAESLIVVDGGTVDAGPDAPADGSAD
ncbi:MAG: hypothetical protein IPJ34_06690 [Myxococcales bacterium]|nr:hypothetical protein [Myxococcales bacterium]